MQVTKIAGGEISYNDIPRPTNEEMQNEYNYILAEQMTRKLLDRGLISVDEFDKIMAKNRRSFSPFISKILR
ncbi:MAG: hypothetical protein J6M66_13205 [Lachnospiraceae bacterium]|jgi:hypothetical protein|nr:hypothetical protein [Lachnospiraceae bacterium]